MEEPKIKKIPYSKTYERQNEYAREYYDKHKEEMRARARERLYKKAGGVRPPGRPRKNAPNGGFIQIYNKVEEPHISPNNDFGAQNDNTLSLRSADN